MGNPRKGNPPSVDSLAAETDRGFDEAEKLSARVERYGRARARALKILAVLRHESLEEIFEPEASRLERCGEYLLFRHYYTVGKVRLHRAYFCDLHLLCPFCAIRRGAKTLAAYLARFEILAAAEPRWVPYLVTLTVVNGPDLKERFNHLRSGVQTMLAARRRALSGSRDRSVFSGFHAIVGSYEVTNRGNGWHPHVHMLVLASSKPSQATLSEEWHSRTGDSFIVDVSPMGRSRAISRDFCEVFKYAVKFSEMRPVDSAYAYACLKGKRLLFSAGAFRGVQLPKNLGDEPLENLPYIELFYRYLPGIGYSFRPPNAVAGSKNFDPVRES